MNRPQPHRPTRLLAAATLALAVASLGAPAAFADAPPASWTNERVLTCDGQAVHTYLTPAGFGTPFHVVDSTDVIIPKYVEVVFPDDPETYVTLHVPGFNHERPGATHCTYKDPAGLQVDFWGVRR